MKAAILKQFARVLHRSVALGCSLAERRALQYPYAHAAQIFLAVNAHGHRRRMRVTRVGSSHNFEERANIRNRARHWAHDANPPEGARTGREVTGCGNAPRRGLQPADAAKMRGHANGAAAVAPHASH